MPRHTWTPETDEQHAAIAAIEQAAATLNEAEQALWAAVDAARAVGVPMTYAAKKTGRGRATAYRRRARTS